MKIVLLHTHTGLGDLFVQEAIIRHWAAINVPPVYFLTEYLEEARELFEGVHNVRPIKVGRSYTKRHNVSILMPVGGHKEEYGFGFYFGDHQRFGGYYPGTRTKTFDSVNWDREFYRHASLPFGLRWKNVKLPSPDRYTSPTGNRILIHDEPAHRITRVDGRRIEPIAGKTLFTWMPAIIKAQELHCIDSCVLNLVESMWANGYINPWTELYFHRQVRPTPPPTLMAPWRIVE